MSNLNLEKHPIVPHGGDCCGCLVVIERQDEMANLVCNECGLLIQTVPTVEALQVLLRMAMNEGMCNATCTHCGAFNVILGFTSVEEFICRECGEGVRWREGFNKNAN